MNASRAASKSTARKKPSKPSGSAPAGTRRIAVIGAGMAGLACARTLMQAGHDVHVYERLPQAGGRMRSVNGAQGAFDIGAQYFTVRDARFEQALQTVPGLCRPWSVSTLRVLDAQGRQSSAAPAPTEAHWVATPDMQALPMAWAAPLWDAGRLHLGQRVTRLERHGGAASWRLHLETIESTAQVVESGFDAVVLALPAPLARQLLQTTPLALPLVRGMAGVEMAPCWTLTLSYPMATEAGLSTLGPQWNAARTTHERAVWVARESSKPGRSQSERWTVHASPQWSQEHRADDAPRVLAKMQKAFGEITRIRVPPRHASVYLWPQAQTLSPLGRSHVWNAGAGLGLCGDWCLGRRVEDAFVSGLEMALALVPA
ncbi:glutamate synthase subunit beta [Delftia tsuruhatensis]|uniref:NAD(P)/FAD-dependent oxidoreductase n=1 Tax=Delftia tsuruhatensis TaxID=180282 RepID=UPI001E743E6C|nr:FAD-dependent oxidoreductase [Delftia tsuruhatensis]CAB5672042.1 glutamate synthase subunit beta [Delftia tsuruhatensis]CAC9683347.1 glutamate synthase subunit beta [Delftia tsuruhatensis]